MEAKNKLCKLLVRANRMFSSKVMRPYSTTLVILLLSQSTAIAADMVIQIKEHTLNRAVSAVRAEGEYNYTKSVLFPCYIQDMRVMPLLGDKAIQTTTEKIEVDRETEIDRNLGEGGLSPSGVAVNKKSQEWPEYIEVHKEFCVSYLPPRIFEWKVLSAKYEISDENGVRLTGILRIREQGNISDRYFPFNKNVEVSFNPSESKLDLIITDSLINETVLSLGEPILIGPIDIGPYYSTSRRLFASFNPVGSSNVNVRASSVNIQKLDGVMKLNADLLFY